MNVTKLEVLEARLLLARATCEAHDDVSDYDSMSERGQANRELMLANDALVEYVVESNKTDLERLEERVGRALRRCEVASEAVEDAVLSRTEKYNFYEKLKLDLDVLRKTTNE